MKLSAVTVILAVASLVASSALEAGPVPAEEEVAIRGLGARACVASKCRCNAIQGQFCGNESVNKYCTNGHVFECNKSTGATCTYGVRTSCQKCGKLSC